MNFTTHTAAMVSFRKEQGLTQADVAQKMNTTQSAVARLEKSLLGDSNVTLSAIERYSDAIGLSIHWTLKPKKTRYGIFATAEDAVDFAVHSSACDDLKTPKRDIEKLKRVARGEISTDKLIEHFIEKALEKKEISGD